MLAIFTMLLVPAITKADQTALATISNVVSQTTQFVPELNANQTTQTIEIYILNSTFKGSNATITNDLEPLHPGDKIYINIADGATKNNLNDTNTTITDVYRLQDLVKLVLIFIALVVIFGGWQGVRALMSFAGSLVLILFVLLPGILHGYSPIGVSIGVSALIIILGSYITHGFNKTTTSAILGMIITIIVSGLFAVFAVSSTHLTGTGSEEALFLLQQTGGQVNLVGILLGGILIGLLGVLYDISISQAISVEELRRANPNMHYFDVYKRAIRIGKEHIGALINTLAIAYVGASLPLLLLFYSYNTGVLQIINKELFATEIVRILVGSAGLVIAVPITTIVAVVMLKNVVFKEESHQQHSYTYT